MACCSTLEPTTSCAPGALHFPRRLARDRVSGWRWLVGAFGIGTYRQDDSVDVRYQRDGRSHVAQQLAIEPGPDR